MKTSSIFALSTAIGALFTIAPPTYAAERHVLERRTKFIIYDNKYEIINAQKLSNINIANDAINGGAKKSHEMKWEISLAAACFDCQMCSNNF